jgi:hypothetical protein
VGISTIGQVDWGVRLRYVLATLLVFLAVFYFFYGPPLTERFRNAAHAECNELTGSNYRTYRLEWRTTTHRSVSLPHWLCWDTSRPGAPAADLGWWVAP